MDLSERIEVPLPPSAHVEPVGPAKIPALLSFDAFCALLAEHPGLSELQLQGAGEPLAHPRFFDMVAHAAARGIAVSTSTSLLTISDARLARCVASGLRRIDVALGARHPSDCDYLRPGSKLRRALRNVQRLAAARSVHPELRLVLMLLRSQQPLLPDLVRLAKVHGADAIVLQHLWHDVCPARRFVEAESLLKEKVDFSELEEVAQGLGVRLKLPHAARCQRPWRTLHVGASGEALPCQAANTAQRLNLGNMRRDGVVRVWNNDAYREFREQLVSDNPPQLCRSCALYQRAA
jgi:radical SAM protein with 4Fe4S-binding SPASM domain